MIAMFFVLLVMYFCTGLMVVLIGVHFNIEIDTLQQFSFFTVLIGWPIVLIFLLKLLIKNATNIRVKLVQEFKNLWNILNNT